jgi:putative hydrolase of the HAD superfamily
MKYKHLFFDLDHTLWDFDANAKIALTEIYSFFNLESLGVKPFDDFYRHYLHHNEILWNRYHKGYMTGEELKWKRMWRTLLEFKIGDEKLAREMSKKFLELLPSKKQLFPHTIEILDYLVSKKYELHMITNGFEQVQWRKLNSSGLDVYFRNV